MGLHFKERKTVRGMSGKRATALMLTSICYTYQVPYKFYIFVMKKLEKSVHKKLNALSIEDYYRFDKRNKHIEKALDTQIQLSDTEIDWICRHIKFRSYYKNYWSIEEIKEYFLKM